MLAAPARVLYEGFPMRPRHLVLVLRLSFFVAIAASAAMVVDYQNAGDPAFCGVTSGCFAVRMSSYSRPFGVPLPTIGLAAFTSLLAGSLLVRRPEHHRILAGLAALGGLGGAVLLGLQAFAVGAFCAWCIAVDTAAIVAGAAAAGLAWLARRYPEAFALEVNPTGAVFATWLLAAVAAIGLPMLWGKYPVVPDAPAEIAALGEPGKLTIVGFTDFECPFCRRLHPTLHQIQAQYGDRARLVRKMMPLQSHPGALPAAKAYVCTPPAQREAAAALLYTADPDQLTDAAVGELLAPLKLDAPAFAACLSAPSTQAAIDADVALYRKLGGMGLPFTFVGRRVVLGYNPARVEDAARLEAAGPQTGLPLPMMFMALGAVAAGAAVVSLLSRPGALGR